MRSISLFSLIIYIKNKISTNKTNFLYYYNIKLLLIILYMHTIVNSYNAYNLHDINDITCMVLYNTTCMI